MLTLKSRVINEPLVAFRLSSRHKSLMRKGAPNRIRELRQARGWSQERLAKTLGTSNQQISKLETGKGQLTVAWMERIARALNCQPAEILPASAPPKAVIEAGGGLHMESVHHSAGLLYQRLFDANIQTDSETFGSLVVELAKDARTRPDGSIDKADLERMIRFAIAGRKPK